MPALHDKRLLLYLTIVWLAVIAICCYVMAGVPDMPGGQSPRHEARYIQGLGGFTYRQFSDSGLVVRLDAEALAVMPRRFLAFNIRSVNEVHIDKARIEARFYPVVAEDPVLLPPVMDELSDREGDGNGHRGYREFGLISRTLVRGVHADLYRQDRLAVVLRAEAGYVDHRRRNPRFTGVVLENAESTLRILSDKVIWDRRDRLFRIPGSYVAYTDKGKADGRGITVDLDFTVRPI